MDEEKSTRFSLVRSLIGLSTKTTASSLRKQILLLLDSYTIRMTVNNGNSDYDLDGGDVDGEDARWRVGGDDDDDATTDGRQQCVASLFVIVM